MRAVFFLLLFANLAYLAWAQWIDVPQPVATNDAYAKLPRLKLVGETPGATRKQPASGGARKTALQKSPEGPKCLSVGPFYDEASATRADSVLREKGLAPRPRAVQGEVPKGFWVYIGGLKTDRDVAQVMRVLQQSHVDDAHVMPDSGDERRVSVGLFSERDRADRRAQALRKLGLEPEVAGRTVAGQVFWMDLDLAPGARAPTAQDFAGGADGGSQASVVPCPGGGAAASPDDPVPIPAAPAPGDTTTFRTKVASGASQVP